MTYEGDYQRALRAEERVHALETAARLLAQGWERLAASRVGEEATTLRQCAFELLVGVLGDRLSGG